MLSSYLNSAGNFSMMHEVTEDIVKSVIKRYVMLYKHCVIVNIPDLRDWREIIYL